MEKEKLQCLKSEESVAGSSKSLNLPSTIKDILMIDINHCKERILESQQKLEHIQSLLKLTRYSSIKEFYENKKTLLDSVHDDSLQGIDPLQHPTILAAQAQLLKLTTKRSTRQAVKKSLAVDHVKNNKIQSKTKQANSVSTLVKTESKKIKIENQTEFSANKKSEDDSRTLLNPNRSSRFFTKYTLLIGNTSQFVGDDNSDNCTHNWCVYIRRPEDQPSISEILQKVRFYLDASYKPNDVVEVVGEPFSLNKRGWGEFPVKIEMFFKSNDKPVFFLHHLKLDKLKSGRYCLETETAVEVSLNIDPNHSSNKPKTNVPDYKFICLKENSDNVDNSLTNIKNIIEQNNSTLDLDIKMEIETDSKDLIKDDIQSLNEIDQYIELNDDIVLHCIQNYSNHEYLVKLPKKIKVFNLKYHKTAEKILFINSIENKSNINETSISVEEKNDLNLPKSLKRSGSEVTTAIPNKIKSIQSNSINCTNTKISQPILNNIPVNRVTKSAKPVILENRSLLKKCSSKSLLKCNNILQLQNSKQICNNKKFTSILNRSFTSDNLVKRLNISNSDPKIIILRKGNSVLTTQSPITLQVGRITLSPERKLLGIKKNCDNAIKANINTSKVYDTFDRDISFLKLVVGQLNIKQIISFALKKISLYEKSNSFQGVFFDVPTQDEFKKLSLMRQIILEIKRAKCIYDFLKELYPTVPRDWDYINILKYAREHGFLPKEHKYWTHIQNILESNSNSNEHMKESRELCSYSNAYDLLEYFNKTLKSIPRDIHDVSESIDVETVTNPYKMHIQKEDSSQNFTLPILYGNDGECQLISESVKMLGLSLQPEQLIHGVNHPSALEILCNVIKTFVSDLIRSSLGVCRSEGDNAILPEHIFAALLSRSEFDILTNKNLGYKKV